MLNCIRNQNQLGKQNHVSIARIPAYAGVHGNEVAYYFAKSGSKSEMHGPEPFITVPYARFVSTVKDWSTDRWKSVWNKRKHCLKMMQSVGWMSSRPIIRLLDLTRPQLNRAVQVLTGYCNPQRHKKTTCHADSSLCPNVAWRMIHQIIMLAIASFTKILVSSINCSKCLGISGWARGCQCGVAGFV